MLPATRANAFAALAAVVLFALLAAFGARYHWVEETGSAERDGYVAEAEQLLAGELPSDPFRPPLYPFAIAGVARFTGNPFMVARLLSNLSAAALAWIAFAITRRLARPEDGALAGGVAMALVAANPNLWIQGQHVASDMPFAALAGAALLAALAYLARPSLSAALCAALAYGAAACTRGNALLLLPGLLGAWWLGSRRQPWQRSLFQLTLATLLATALLLPHWWLRARLFGSPFHDENWKNLWWKLHGDGDWSRLAELADTGSFGQIVRDEPGAIARSAVDEMVKLGKRELNWLLGAWPHLAAGVAGTLLCLRLRDRGTRWLFATLTLFTLGIATVFFTWVRLLLVLLPAAAAMTAVGGLSLVRSVRSRRLFVAGAVVLVAWLAVKTVVRRLPSFIDLHPYAEVATLERLDRELDTGRAPDATLAGTSPFLGRYLTHDYFEIPDAFGAETRDAAAYGARLVETLRKGRAAFLVVGVDALSDRPRALLSGVGPPAGLELVERTERLTVWRVLPGS